MNSRLCLFMSFVGHTHAFHGPRTKYKHLTTMSSSAKFKDNRNSWAPVDATMTRRIMDKYFGVEAKQSHECELFLF